MEAYGDGQYVQGLNTGTNGIHHKAGDEDEEDEEVALAKAGAQDEHTVAVYARKLDRAISALLQLEKTDPAQQLSANEWLTKFVANPFAWTSALYVAFPPGHDSGVGRAIENRYFALNILLGKIRSDWIQLDSNDALEIYKTVLGELPSNLANPWFASRILVLLSAAAAVAGEQAAVELVQSALNPSPLVNGHLVLDLLISVAEEVFMHSRARSSEVVDSLRNLSPEVFKFLEVKAESLSDPEQEAKIFVCLERWINAGFTLSELYSTYTNLLKALLAALGSGDDRCFEAAISALSEYIAAVDLLPERNAAVDVTISAILAQQQLYVAAESPGEVSSSQYSYLRRRSRGLVVLVTVLASSEAPLLARGGTAASTVLDWLVDASTGGGGLNLEGASIATVAWARLAAVPVQKRSDNIGPTRFAAAAKAVMHAIKYPELNGNLDNASVEEELLRYREGSARDALAVFLDELGTSFLSHILSELQQAVTWESAEVCLFTAAALSQEIKGLAGLSDSQAKHTSSEGEQVAARSFLSAVFVWVSASVPPTMQDLTGAGSSRLVLVRTTLQVVEKLAEWAAVDLKSLESGLKYAMSALQISEVRDSAAKALGEVCRAAASHIVAAPALKQVFDAYELALTAPEKLETASRLSFVEGLAVVASALPLPYATELLKNLTFTAFSTVKALAEMRAPANVTGQVLAEELRVVAVVVSHGSPNGGDPLEHPALPILREIWPLLDVVVGHWSGDADVVTAVCELWGVVAKRLGMVLHAVLPTIAKSATSMYIQHLIPACLDCLSNIVVLASTSIDDDNIHAEFDTVLTAMLLEVKKTIPTWNKILAGGQARRGPGLYHHTQIGRSVDPEDVQELNAEASLCSISALARTLLHNKPKILLQSTAFAEIISSAIGSIGRVEMGSALAGARLLSETILCLSFSEDDYKGKVVWQLPEELVPFVDGAFGQYSRQVVEVTLQTLAKFELLYTLRDALSDVLYGLCLRYPGETQTYMREIMSAKDYPARKGVLKASDKEAFISVATKHPVQPRRRFQELIKDFSEVCRGLVAAEVLTSY